MSDVFTRDLRSHCTVSFTQFSGCLHSVFPLEEIGQKGSRLRHHKAFHEHRHTAVSHPPKLLRRGLHPGLFWGKSVGDRRSLPHFKGASQPCDTRSIVLGGKKITFSEADLLIRLFAGNCILFSRTPFPPFPNPFPTVARLVFGSSASISSFPRCTLNGYEPFFPEPNPLKFLESSHYCC